MVDLSAVPRSGRVSVASEPAYYLGMAATKCRHFNGYKPCGKIDSLKASCDVSCGHYAESGARILLIHLGALGAVVRSTALLPAIHRRYPAAHITWVTDAPADVLLREHPLVDRVIVSNHDGVMALKALEFDVAFVVDKSLKASGLLRSTSAKNVYGYVADPASGAILPMSPAAQESWELGTSDHLKFHVNRKTETQLVHEALELGTWMRDPYALHLNAAEQREVLVRREEFARDRGHAVIGFNTGCAPTIPFKKLTVEAHVELLALLQARRPENPVVLLGGREDSERNRSIAAEARSRGLMVHESSTDRGLRDGMISVAACDVVVTGDSLGMHMALGFDKAVVAWFGPTCAHEIDLYGGASVLTKAPCAPCWKRSCDKPVMCYDQVDLFEVAQAVELQLVRVKPSLQDVGARLEVGPEL